MTTIGSGAFASGSSLKDVYCYAKSVPVSAETPSIVLLGPFYKPYIEDATLHVPATAIDAYKADEYWCDFGKIVPIDEEEKKIEPLQEDVDIDFGDGCISEDTDLTNAVIKDVFVTLKGGNENYFDSKERCIIIKAGLPEELLAMIIGRDVNEEPVISNYNGFIFEVPAGKGVISVTAQTLGHRALNVKIGNTEANTFVQPERETVKVPYDVEYTTYVYIYGTETTASNAGQRRAASAANEDCVKIYGLKWEKDESATGIDSVVVKDAAPQIYTLDGQRITAPQKGVNIIRYSDGQTKKVFIK